MNFTILGTISTSVDDPLDLVCFIPDLIPTSIKKFYINIINIYFYFNTYFILIHRLPIKHQKYSLENIPPLFEPDTGPGFSSTSPQSISNDTICKNKFTI